MAFAGTITITAASVSTTELSVCPSAELSVQPRRPGRSGAGRQAGPAEARRTHLTTEHHREFSTARVSPAPSPVGERSGALPSAAAGPRSPRHRLRGTSARCTPSAAGHGCPTGRPQALSGILSDSLRLLSLSIFHLQLHPHLNLHPHPSPYLHLQLRLPSNSPSSGGPQVGLAGRGVGGGATTDPPPPTVNRCAATLHGLAHPPRGDSLAQVEDEHLKTWAGGRRVSASAPDPATSAGRVGKHVETVI